MAIDFTVKVKSVGTIEATGGGYHSALTVELNSAELTDAVDAKAIAGEYDNDELLEAIGEGVVQNWLEEQGFTVTYGDAL